MMVSEARIGKQWENATKYLLLATLLISGLAEALVIPMGNTNGDDNGIASSGGADQGANNFAYAYSIPPQCMTSPIHDMPPRLRRLCAALATLSTLSGGVERFYIDDKAIRDNGALLDSGVKRQDIDHVFLRFGRSR